MHSTTTSHVTVTRDCARIVPAALPIRFRPVCHRTWALFTTGHPAARLRPARHSGQGGAEGNSAIQSNVRTSGQIPRGHWMPAVSPLLIEGVENWFRRQPDSRVRTPHTAAVSAALTPHIVQEPPCRPSTAKPSASPTDPHDPPDPLTVRGLERVEIRVVPVSPSPPVVAGQSEPRWLGIASR